MKLTEELISHWQAWGSPNDRDQAMNETTMAFDCKVAALRIAGLEAALDDIASRTDWDRDDCGKAAADALAFASDAD